MIFASKIRPRARNSYDTEVIAYAYKLEPFLLITKSSLHQGGGGGSEMPPMLR